MKKILLLCFVTLLCLQCSEEKEINSVSDLLSSVGAKTVSVEKDDTQTTYYFSKSCKDGNEARTKLRTLVAGVEQLSGQSAVETWTTIDSYYYDYKTHELHFDLNNQILTGHIVEYAASEAPKTIPTSTEAPTGF